MLFLASVNTFFIMILFIVEPEIIGVQIQPSNMSRLLSETAMFSSAMSVWQVTYLHVMAYNSHLGMRFVLPV